MRTLALVACAILASGCATIPCPTGLSVTYEHSRGRYGLEPWVGRTYGISVQSDLGVHPYDCPAWGGTNEEEER